MDYTYNFTPGTRAVAPQVNTNFADVKSAVDPLQTDVATIKTQLTSGIILPDGSVDFTRLQSYATYTVSNATNATPIVITAVAHDFVTGDKVYINGVGGNTAANGVFTITKLGADTFSLNGSVGNGAFSSNGTAVIYPSADDNLVNKGYVDTKQLLDLGTVTTETTLTTGKITLADFNGAVNLVMPSNLPLGVEHTAVVNFTTSSTSQPTIATSGTLKWSDKNLGKAPTAYSIISGVRNILVFKTHDGGVTWEAEYGTFGGVETTFVQPALSANGVLGGPAFAISASNFDGVAYPYLGVDNNPNTEWVYSHANSTYTFYNPLPLKVSSINIANRHDYDHAITGYVISGSDNNIDWTILATGTNNVLTRSAQWVIPINTTNFYKYYKIYTTSISGSFSFSQATLNAVYIAT